MYSTMESAAVATSARSRRMTIAKVGASPYSSVENDDDCERACAHSGLCMRASMCGTVWPCACSPMYRVWVWTRCVCVRCAGASVGWGVSRVGPQSGRASVGSGLNRRGLCRVEPRSLSLVSLASQPGTVWLHAHTCVQAHPRVHACTCMHACTYAQRGRQHPMRRRIG